MTVTWSTTPRSPTTRPSTAPTRAIGNTTLVVNDPTDGAPTRPARRRPSPATSWPATPTSTDPDPWRSAGHDHEQRRRHGDNPGRRRLHLPPDDGVGCGDGSDFFDYTLTDGGTPNAGTDIGSGDDRDHGVRLVRRRRPPRQVARPLHRPVQHPDPDQRRRGCRRPRRTCSDYLFLYGSGTFTTGIVLEANQRLYGQPHGLTVDGTALVAAAGTQPQHTYNGARGVGITLANGVGDPAGQRRRPRRRKHNRDRGERRSPTRIGRASSMLVIGNTIGVVLTGAATGNVTIGATITATAERRSGGCPEP